MTKANSKETQSSIEEIESARIAVTVEEDGSFSINGKPQDVDALNPEFLEQVVEKSLNDCVDYNIKGETPLASFFKSLEEGTNSDSELRKVYLTKTEEGDSEVEDDKSSEEDDSEMSPQ